MKNGKFTTLVYSLFVSVFYLFKTKKKLAYSFLSVILVIAIGLSSVLVAKSLKGNNKKKTVRSTVSKTESVESKTEPTPAPAPAPEPEPEPDPPQLENPTDVIARSINVVPGGKSNTDPDDNDFLDALIYTGYNINKHRSDGLMWVYILAKEKRAKGWLSNITYNFGSSGYEINAQGKPDIARFERGGFVCASYVTYVYFNYLPNVVGIDVSALKKPADPRKAQQWYLAGQDWIKNGYSKSIGWSATLSGNITNFKPDEPIPIGSLMLTQDFNNRNGYATHVSIYAGYKNGYHWVTHVGNENGPEFCAMERMSCGPDPQWPLAIITTPNGIVK